MYGGTYFAASPFGGDAIVPTEDEATTGGRSWDQIEPTASGLWTTHADPQPNIWEPVLPTED